MRREERSCEEAGQFGLLYVTVNGCSVLSQGVTRDVSGVAPTDGEKEDGPMTRHDEVNWAGLIN